MNICKSNYFELVTRNNCFFYSLGNYIADKSVDNFKRVEKLIVHEVDFFIVTFVALK